LIGESIPAFAQFALVAVALFLWESVLWLPLRSVALRRRRRSGRWQALGPRDWFATRETGMIPMFPLPSAGGLAPCQPPPLLEDDDGNFLVDSGTGVVVGIPAPAWEDLRRDSGG
jgi:hypothetical protein